MNANLRTLLSDGDFTVAPGVFEMLSVKIAEGTKTPPIADAENGSTEGSKTKAYDMKQMHELAGFPDVREFERKHVETN